MLKTPPQHNTTMSTLNPPQRLLTRLFKPGTRCTPANILNPDNWIPIYHQEPPVRRKLVSDAELQGGRHRWMAEPEGIRDEVINEDKDGEGKEEYVIFDVDKFRNARFVGDGSDAEKKEEEVVAAKTAVVEVNDTTEKSQNEIVATNIAVAEDKNLEISQAEAATVPNSHMETEKRNKDVVVPDEEVYEVEAIVGHRLKKGVLQYQIKWAGYDLLNCTFEPEENLDGAKEILEDYKKANSLEG